MSKTSKTTFSQNVSEDHSTITPLNKNVNGGGGLTDALDAIGAQQWIKEQKDNETTISEEQMRVHTHPFRIEPFNMNSVQMRGLQRLIKNAEVKKLLANPYLNKNRTEIKFAKIEKIIFAKQADYLERRMKLSTVSKANIYALVGDEYALRQTLELGFPINRRDPTSGRTVLMEAVAGGHFQIARMLLSEFKANARIATLLGDSSPLHMAVERGYRQIASLVITYGADVNVRDRRGLSPLHCVKKISLVKLLHRYKVDHLAKTREGLLPSEYYDKYTLKEEIDPAILTCLIRVEENEKKERKRIELEMYEAAQKKLKHKSIRLMQAQTGSLRDVTSQNSTIITENPEVVVDQKDTSRFNKKTETRKTYNTYEKGNKEKKYGLANK